MAQPKNRPQAVVPPLAEHPPAKPVIAVSELANSGALAGLGVPRAAEYPYLSGSGSVIGTGLYAGITGLTYDARAVGSAYLPTTGTEELRKLERQIETLQAKLTEITTAVSTVATTPQAALLEELQEMKQTLEQMRSQTTVATQQLTAPVLLPAPQDMEVRLISAASFERLEEYRGEESKWSSVAGVFAGALLGIVVNVVTGSPMTNIAWIFGITFFILMGIMVWTAYVYKQRGDRLRGRIVGEHVPLPASTSTTDPPLAPAEKTAAP